MIYRFQNPFVPRHDTEINTDTRHVHHVYASGQRVLSEHTPEWWFSNVPLKLMRLIGDPDLLMDEGL